MPPQSSQLEESNRTLTVDVANLAGEKEELNNQLKDAQQSASPNHIAIPRRVFLHKASDWMRFYFYRVAESQRGRETNELPQSVF